MPADDEDKPSPKIGRVNVLSKTLSSSSVKKSFNGLLFGRYNMRTHNSKLVSKCLYMYDDDDDDIQWPK